MKRILLAALLLSLIGTELLTAQNTSPYQLDLKRELALMGSGIALSVGGRVLQANTTALDSAQIAALDADDIPAFDRAVTENWSVAAQKTSDYTMMSSFATTFFLIGSREVRSDKLVVPVMALEALLINGGLTDMTKGSILRTRPFVYNPEAPMDRKLRSDARFSFFSGHTSYTAVASFFTAKVYTDYHPDSKAKEVVWAAAALLPAVTGYYRYRGGKHFATDIISGYVVGGLVGYGVPYLHRKRDSKTALNVLPMIGPDSKQVLVSLRF